jgi:putative transposase
MAQSLAQVYVHLVFSTKERAPLITAPAITRLHAYLAGSLAAIQCPALMVGGVADHVHLLFSLSKNMALSEVVKHAKIESSKWMKSEGGAADFAWQAGYGAFSVGASQIEAVKTYVSGQEQHHRQRTFQDEFRLLLQRYGVSYDEAYVWG